jgi:UDP-3-O-[3-hydroxymyristoyl] glucosamine N-acyltransferase
LKDLAERVGGRVRGDGERSVTGLRPIATAGPEHLSFLTGARFRDQARSSRAGALLVAPGAGGEDWFIDTGHDLLVVDDPRLALATLIAFFHPVPPPPVGVHPTAVVAAGARVSPRASVGPYAVIEDGSVIEDGAVVGAHVVVGRDCWVGSRSVLRPHAVLYDRTRLGEGVEVHAGVVLGADGFGYVQRVGEGGRVVHHKMPQVGQVVLEDGVEVGANTTIDRATLGETRIGAGTKIDNLVQVGHNVRTGAACLLCGQAGIAGSTHLGDGVVLAGQAGLTDHLEIGDRVQVAAKAAVLSSAPADARLAGVPAVDLRSWRRQVVGLARLPELMRRVAALERLLGVADATTEEGDP